MRQVQEFKGRDGDFHYIDWGGSGPLAHFSHATGFCAGAYTPFTEKLVSHLRVIGIDDRGHGKTRAPADPEKLESWDIFAKDLADFLEHQGRPVIAMGHSRGAVSSLVVAVMRPDLIRALVLVDPTILPFSWMGGWFVAKKMGLSRFIPIAARAARRRRVWPNREAILSAYGVKSPFREWKDGFLDAYIDNGTEDTEEGAIRLCCDPTWESRCFATCSHDVWRYISRLQVPTLVLYGSESDTFLKPAVKRFKTKAPAAVFRYFEGTGHFVPMERPDESAEAILTFLRDIQIM
ncbi:MAG: alpha/beta hydrolase [Pseudomonadota bacterium]